MLGLQAIDPHVTYSVEFMDNAFKETFEPVLGGEEKPIAPPGELGEGAVRCDECGYRNMPAWGRCYGCGSPLETNKAEIVGEPIVKLARAQLNLGSSREMICSSLIGAIAAGLSAAATQKQ